MDVLAYCLIIVVAGNETTRNATTGGMLAFIEHQEELRKLQANPSLLALGDRGGGALDLARSSTSRAPRRADYELRGKRIRDGDVLALFYPSANRDEEVFDDPFAFRSTATRTRTSASASASTSASARTSRASS